MVLGSYREPQTHARCRHQTRVQRVEGRAMMTHVTAEPSKLAIKDEQFLGRDISNYTVISGAIRSNVQQIKIRKMFGVS